MKLLKIKKREDFLNIQGSFDKKIYSANFIFLVKKNENFFGNCRFAPVATKKISKLAVIRNKVKRIIREIIRNIYKDNYDLFVQNLDYEVIAKKSILEVKFSVLYDEINTVLLNIKNSN